MTQAFNLAQFANNVNSAGQAAAGTSLSGAVLASNGGTGLTAITANNVILGNGTSAVQVVAPGTSGNVLLSNGTTWVSGAASAPVDVQTFNATGTWTKPTGGQTMARIQVWSGGGGAGRGTTAGGSAAGGGGGGGYNELVVPLSTLAATITATIGAGGTGRTGSTGAGTAGGNSTFGSVCVSFGGGGGSGNAGFAIQSGGGGGGSLSAGTTGNQNTTGYGRPYYAYRLTMPNNCPDYQAIVLPTPFNGGTSVKDIPGDSLYGGGGGAQAGSAGGLSVYGGAGGAINSAGTAPAGGGGCNSLANGNGFNGAAGRIVVTSW